MNLAKILLLSALLASKSSAATSSTDLWDINQGSIVTSNSPMGYGAVTNMFGDNQVSIYAGEAGHALFTDWNLDGFVASVEWQTPHAILLSGYNLSYGGDLYSGRRGIALFRLFGRSSVLESWQLLSSFSPIQPQMGDAEHSDSFATQELRFFRAEFTQLGNVYGTRVMELDAIATVPEPSVAGVFASFTALGLLRRRIRR